MKHAKLKLVAAATLLLFGISGAVAQSLGDYARTVRKNKPDPTSTTHHYDNDNLPTNETLSVVGPTPAPATDGAAAQVATDPAADRATAEADRKKAADEWKDKLATQQDKINALSHELDLQQREYRLRAASYYGDAGARLRNTGEWDKEDSQYKNDVNGKQKAIDAAKQELQDLQEQARKAGIREKDKDEAQK
jgi:phytoene dehydrogenase-like protein